MSASPTSDTAYSCSNHHGVSIVKEKERKNSNKPYPDLFAIDTTQSRGVYDLDRPWSIDTDQFGRPRPVRSARQRTMIDMTESNARFGCSLLDESTNEDKWLFADFSLLAYKIWLHWKSGNLTYCSNTLLTTSPSSLPIISSYSTATSIASFVTYSETVECMSPNITVS